MLIDIHAMRDAVKQVFPTLQDAGLQHIVDRLLTVSTPQELDEIAASDALSPHELEVAHLASVATAFQSQQET